MCELRRYLTRDEWNDLIENKRFQEVTSININVLTELNEKASLLLQMDVTNDDFSNDSHTWSFSNSKTKFRHRPMYKKMVVRGQSIHVIQYTDYFNPNLKKDVLKIEGKLYLHYFLKAGSYQEPDSSTKKESRIGVEQREKVRQLLKSRTVDDAYKMARDSGINVSKTQVKNQSKNVADVKKGRSGPKMHVTKELLDEISSEHPGDVHIEIDSSEMNFRIVKVFSETINVYLASCPQEAALVQWKERLKWITVEDNEVRKNELKKILDKSPGGLIFPNRLFIDTTFNVSSCYVTLVLGEVPVFQTKNSGKNRVIPLGFMIHTSKSIVNHTYFAERLERMCSIVRPKYGSPQPPCVVIDGEAALLQYSMKLNAPPVRCDFHLLSLLSHKFGSKATEEAKKLIFGRTEGTTWKRGILGSYDGIEFDKKIDSAESYIDTRIMNWLKLNKTMLMECSSIGAKLNSGHILNYSTTNISESFNGLLKSYVLNHKRVDSLLGGLVDFVKHSYTELWNSAIGNSETVLYKDVLNASRQDFRQKLINFAEVGLMSVMLLSFDPPKDICMKLNIEEAEKEEKKAEKLKVISSTKNSILVEDESEMEGSPERIVLVKRDGRALYCRDCEQRVRFLCCHLISSLNWMKEPDRRIELLWIWDRIREKPKKPQMSIRSGHKPSDRLGCRYSKNNHIRDVLNISEMTVLQEKEISDSLFESSGIEPRNRMESSFEYDSSDTENFIGYAERTGNSLFDQIQERSVNMVHVDADESTFVSNIFSPPGNREMEDSTVNLNKIPIRSSTPVDQPELKKRGIRKCTLEQYGFTSVFNSTKK